MNFTMSMSNTNEYVPAVKKFRVNNCDILENNTTWILESSISTQLAANDSEGDPTNNRALITTSRAIVHESEVEAVRIIKKYRNICNNNDIASSDDDDESDSSSTLKQNITVMTRYAICCYKYIISKFKIS